MPRAVVIGAGPAGLSAAIGLLRRDFEVTVHEQRPRWQGRVCGGFLNAEAVRHLDWLGVLNDVQKEAVVVRRTVVSIGSSFRAVELEHQNELGLSRQRLEEILMERVREEGGDVQIGKRYCENGCEDLVIFASGRFSSRHPGESRDPGLQHREKNWTPAFAGVTWYGWNASFENVGQKPGDMSLHFYPGGYVGTLTYGNGETNVCGLVKRNPGEVSPWDKIFEKACSKSPVFRERMKYARRVSEWHGVGSLPFGVHWGGGEICVGDAAAVGEPFMGEGIGRALSAGPMLYDVLGSSLDNLTNSQGNLELSNCQDLTPLWDAAYGGRFRIGSRLRRLLFDHPIFFTIFSKSLDLTALDRPIARYLWRKINEYGYHAQNIPRSKLGEVLSV